LQVPPHHQVHEEPHLRRERCVSLTGDIDAHVLTPGSKCSVAVVYATLEPDDLVKVTRYIDERRADGRPRYAASAVEAFLASNDVVLGEHPINRHRRGKCKCPR
jgi:2,3-bisphosphoglycerate-independent phosphoglycerate mutase